MEGTIPQSVKAALWSYDSTKLDLNKDKERIITNVLNYGTREAIDWLFATYERDEIREVVANPRPGEWDRKSLNFWCIIFDIDPNWPSRF